MNRSERLHQQAQEKAWQSDRRYFEAHPQQTCYLREVLPGEAPAAQARWIDYVEVTQVAPGIRTRRFIKSVSDVDGC